MTPAPRSPRDWLMACILLVGCAGSTQRSDTAQDLASVDAGTGVDTMQPDSCAPSDETYLTPTLVGPVNSAVGDFAPDISADDLALFFHRSTPFGLDQVFVATRPSATAPFGSPDPLGEGATPSISADGLLLYVAIGGTLMVRTRANMGVSFDAPSPVEGLNSGDYSNYSPELASDNVSLYYESDEPGGAGGRDILVATRSVGSQVFANKTRLTINSAHHDGGPTISRDGLTLIFHSDRSTPGKPALWIARRASTAAPWSSPVLLPAHVSANASDPSLSADGGSLFFQSLRGGPDSGDIWVSQRLCQ